jgi:hypothetical protein
MGRELSTWRDRTRDRLGNPSSQQISPGSLEDHVRAAIRTFSSDRPRVTFANFVGDGVTFDLAISSLTGWVHGFSGIEAIEHPQGEREPLFLDEQSWQLYPFDSAPTAVRLLATIPAVGTTARVYYSVPWPIPTSDPTVDKMADTDYEPLVALAASQAALELAGRAAGHQRPSLPSASLVGEQTEEARWLELSRALAKEYRTHVGAGAEGQEPPAMTVGDWDASSTWRETGKRFLIREPRR